MDDQPNVTQRKRLRFRPLHSFSLRTLFVVVTVFGCWLGYQLNWIRQRHEAITAGHVPSDQDKIVPAPGLLWLFGERGHAYVFIRVADSDELTTAEEADLKHIGELFPEADLGAESGPGHPKPPSKAAEPMTGSPYDGFKL
jgi:hypothetical protein